MAAAAAGIVILSNSGPLPRVAFIDCVFEQCDISNAQMNKGTMQRTTLADCKLVGISLTESFLLDSVVERCVARYANLFGSKMRHVKLIESDFSNASLAGCTLGVTAFTRCSLIRAELFGTLCKGMDLSDCELSGIALSGGELRGAKVNLEQAAMLGQLIAGVVIKE